MRPAFPRFLSLFLSSSSSSSLSPVTTTTTTTTTRPFSTARTSAATSRRARDDDSVRARYGDVDVATRFVLVDTKHPGNVGAAARAMKTMGFSDLTLVAPRDPRVLGRKKCVDGASGAANVLRRARVVDRLEDAVANEADGPFAARVVCGTGMPVDMSVERPPRRYAPPRRFFAELLEQTTTKTRNDDDGDHRRPRLHVTFVFGNERVGMSADDMDRCDVVLGIPTNPEFGSLNLATAVQIIAYDWREALGGYDHDDDDDNDN